jgi:LDH2 family malate/lactate/ureidoglycolate dehydrogenase
MEGGSLMFTGGDLEGHKFYALSLFNEALTVLAGGSANNPGMPPRQSFSLAVLDPSAFAGSEYYLEEMKRFVAHLKGSRARTDLDGVRLPGERGFKALEDARLNGVPLDESKLRMLGRIAHEIGIEPIEGER